MCRCTGAIIQRYLGKISGPLLDRIDLHIEVPAVAYQEMRSKTPGASSAEMRARVSEARVRQAARGFVNAEIPPGRLRELCPREGDVLGKGEGDVLGRGRPDVSLRDLAAVYTAPGPADWF